MAAFRFHPFFRSRSIVPQVVSDFPQEQGLIFRSIRHTLVPRRGFTKKHVDFFWVMNLVKLLSSMCWWFCDGIGGGGGGGMWWCF